MKIYHLLFLFWIIFVTLWTLNQVRASHDRRTKNKK